MINKIVSMLGYSGSDPIVTYIVVMTSCILLVCLAYKLLDFILSLISSFIGRGNKIQF